MPQHKTMPVSASDLLVQCLEAEGVEYIFGIPGEENAQFMFSLQKSTTIKFVLTRHEQAAAFMAGVYGRLTGQPAGCLGTLGPGATNLITGVADANMDHAPMLVLTGQGESTRLHKESHQVMDVVAMFRPVTKWAHSILHPDTIPEVTRKAVRLARSEKPGAVHLELPEDIAQMETSARPLEPYRFRRPVADQKSIDQAFAVLQEARRPVIIAGNGCIRKRASRQLREFCSKTGIGVISTFMAKGAVDRNADYSLFTVGLQAKDLVSCVIDSADLVITLGYDMVEYHPRLWNHQQDKRIVHIDFLPAEIDEHYHPQTEVIGDLAHALWMLNQKVDACLQAGEKFAFDFKQQAAVRRDMLKDFAKHKNDKASGSIKPQKALWDVRQVLGPRDILLSDVGAHKMWIARYFHCSEPNTCLIPNGFCAMGFAFPGAIAASLVAPERRVLAICGDGGFLMNLQEMETARRLNANIVVLVWEDKSYGLIEWKQENEFGSHTDLAFSNPDWQQLAKAFGWHGHCVDSSQNLLGALEVAFQEKGPSLVVIPIDYRENKKLTQRLGNIACPI